MAKMDTENKKSTIDKAIGLLIDGIELYSPSVLNESIYFGEISSVDILNSGSGYDVINSPILEILDTEGYGQNAKIYPNLKGRLTEVLVLNPGIGYERKPTLSLTGGNFKGSVELETNLIKKSLTASFAPTPVSVSSTTITFISSHNFENGEEITHEQMTYWEYLYQFDTSYLWEEIMDQCTWDELSGVKETLGSVWMKLSSEEILKIEQQY